MIVQLTLLYRCCFQILVGDFPCTSCAAIRSGSIQAASAAMYPLVLGPLVCVAQARKYLTSYVPGLAERAELLPFLQRILPRSGVLVGLVLANFMLGMLITERETVLFAQHLSPTSDTTSQEEEVFQ
jgi:hypothetical protein